MHIDFLFERFEMNKECEAIVWEDKTYTYEWFLNQIKIYTRELNEHRKMDYTIVSLEADYSPYSIAMFLALIELGCTVVPILNSLVDSKKKEYYEIVELENVIKVERASFEIINIQRDYIQNELLLQLKKLKHPGLVLFSSGTTGRSKAIVHDFTLLQKKYSVARSAKRVIPFMLFDHIGGVNTLFQIISSSGCLVIIDDRTPNRVCNMIEKHQVQALPASPTFINLLILSEAYKKYNLNSLQTISYGSEVMPEATLSKINEIFPHVKITQMYGLSEYGVLYSQSKSNDSLWIKLSDKNIESRVVDGMLQIKSMSTMIGYINAPSPFTQDGWLMTGDMVEVDEDYIKILGRKSEIINIGGEKVFPAEVENVIQVMDGVEEVAVVGEKNAITGQIVKAVVKLSTNESVSEFRKRLREFCKDKLPLYKIPQKVVLTTEKMHTERFKKDKKVFM
ncbi:fatty acid--CoA ligase family protein [Bacillus bombysepticus]